MQVSRLCAYTATLSGEVELDFTLRTRRLGRIQLPCRIHAVGSAQPPIEFVLAARSTGPTIAFGTPDAPIATAAAAVAFGKVPVLDTHTQTLTLHNASLIDASLKAFVAGQGSAFTTSVREATLAPGGVLDIAVSVRLDETVAFTDVLHCLVENGDELEVPLSASGTGNTLYCADISGRELLDLGEQFTAAAFRKTIVVQNHGRRAMSVAWVNADLERAKKELGKLLRGANGKPDMSLMPPERQAAFAVEPERGVLAAKAEMEFVVSGASAKARALCERLQMLAGPATVSAQLLHAPLCAYVLVAEPEASVSSGCWRPCHVSAPDSRFGASLLCTVPQATRVHMSRAHLQGKAEKVVFDVDCVANVAPPLLTFSERALTFDFCYDPHTEQPPKQRTVTVTNETRLPLAATLRAAPPFALSANEVALQPGASTEVTVTMHYDFRHDLVSQQLKCAPV